MLAVLAADVPERLKVARELTYEYSLLPHVEGRWLDVVKEIESLPGPYQAPRGGLILASSEEGYLGCVAFAPLSEGAAELKRLFVRPEARGKGVGLLLVQSVIERVRSAGYSRLRLDTAPELTAAISLYRRLGFREIGRYRDDLYADAVCFELELPIH